MRKKNHGKPKLKNHWSDASIFANASNPFLAKIEASDQRFFQDSYTLHANVGTSEYA